MRAPASTGPAMADPFRSRTAPAPATSNINATSVAVCHGGAIALVLPLCDEFRENNGGQAPCSASSSTPLRRTKAQENAMMIAAMTIPTLAAGWSLLYLLFGGGLGGAVLLFVVLKAIGR